MKIPEDHKKYRWKIFDRPLMRKVLTADEYADLTEYGAWMEALYQKKIDPISEAQEKFCENLKLDTPPEDYFSRIFWLYLKRMKLYQNGKLIDVRKTVEDDREDWKKIRKMRF